MIQIGIHSYKYLLIYELREETREFLTKTLTQIKGDLDFELQPHPLAWTLGPEIMETNQTL